MKVRRNLKTNLVFGYNIIEQTKITLTPAFSLTGRGYIKILINVVRKKQNMKEKIKLLEKEIAPRLDKIQEIVDYNQKKVLDAFIQEKIGQHHFAGTTGYGHDDLGRAALEKVFSHIFKSEAALVRPHFASGTHTLACVLLGILRPGDILLSVAGEPYDTMHEVIGIRGENQGSLKDFGVKYEQLDLLENGTVNIAGLKNIIKTNTKMALIQRSRGYDWRPSIDIDTLEKIIKEIKSIKEDVICFVDNCYGEFTEMREPIEAGADITAGSLIKNPGGGIVHKGGYIAGKAELVEQAACRLYAPGIGSEGGATGSFTFNAFQGIFMAPAIVGEALKGCILASKVFESFGYNVWPGPDDLRTDIIQAVRFEKPDLLKAFCLGIQKASPVDSYLEPIGWMIPGYEDEVIMAGGTFIEGSTIELSADGPLRPPYIGYWQGGLNYSHCKIGLQSALIEMEKVKK